jgi:hypothetical protein
MGLVDRGQQFDIGPSVARRETVPAILRDPHLAAGRAAMNQTRNLCPAEPVIFSMWRRNRQRATLPWPAYFCSMRTRSIHSNAEPGSRSQIEALRYPINPRICSKPSFSASFTLIVNPSAWLILQAPLVLDKSTRCRPRLRWRKGQVPGPC